MTGADELASLKEDVDRLRISATRDVAESTRNTLRAALGMGAGVALVTADDIAEQAEDD